MDVITFPENLLTTSGLSILLHGVISLPDATSYDKCRWNIFGLVHKKNLGLQPSKTQINLLSLYGPQPDKTCLRGFRQSEIQTILLSYRD